VITAIDQELDMSSLLSIGFKRKTIIKRRRQ
jgi:hypothetical protein